MTDQMERPRLSMDDIALLCEISRWRRNHGVSYFQWRPGVGFGPFSEWKRYGDNGLQINVSYEPDRTDSDDPRPHVAVTKNYYGGEFAHLPYGTVTQIVDMLVALGYLPPRFSSAYRAGWHAAEVWHHRWLPNDPCRQDAEHARLFLDVENINFPVGGGPR